VYNCLFYIAWGSSKTKASGGWTQTPGRSVRCHCARLLTNEEAWRGDARHKWWVSCICVEAHGCFSSHRGKITIWFLEYSPVNWSCAIHWNLRQIKYKTILLPTHEEAVMPSCLLTGNFYYCMRHRETLLRLLGGGGVFFYIKNQKKVGNSFAPPPPKG
jgi:hypothetical protein